ncbi:uncharacterized protein CANTADRAFT_7369 [Suhomyces tanzawaensis NRRL Y-17324]|uniref:Uncharacterized protein n=1 Tax=Suhomyces tanzawaensis NRRL Y-17324 TaxID=984487 RepID=A0A1E4SEH2_9ASCO|nr:uncharacterized protein CANTADRAFT_7369 [Suhomyces tanzawaensis NRRL Y-17324]ODV77888.1 hypothetical protein CANTADRAFT_7369 [Suhomyces tanzawaensis NRRL Y-17324]
MGGVSLYQTSFKIDKKRRPSPASSRLGNQKGIQAEKTSKVGIHKWATEPHKSLVFSLGKDNDLMAKRTNVPGTSIIKIDHKRVNYVNPKTESIKYPEMSGIRLFEGPNSIPVALAPSYLQHKPTNEQVLELEAAKPAPMFKSHVLNKKDGAQPQLMNVRPYTNLEPGTSSKFSLQKHLEGEAPLPGTSIIFPNEYIPLEQASYAATESNTVRLNNQSSKDWQVFTMDPS